MFKQPRVPEYRENEGAAKHLKALTLFLKDFCQDVWTACRLTDKGLDGIKYPVTSVNEKTGDVVLDAADVNAVKKDGDTMTGALNAPYVNIKDSSESRTHLYINFYKAKVADHIARIQMRAEDSNRRFAFLQAHEDQDNAASVYRQYFYLPLAEAGLTAHKYYHILTSKAPVTVEQGGTGATTPEAARSALGALASNGTAANASKLGGNAPSYYMKDFGRWETLWSGSWSSGSITVPNTSNYHIFKIGMSGQGTAVLAVKQSPHIRGIGGYTTDGHAITTYQFTATYSEDEWTLVMCDSIAHNTSAGHGGASTRTITSIVGVI